ncbi:YtrH family sporulation protein [Alkaliphilus peptidifermentans]|uniref:Sporulation protein YtrH n=1 Tax=Alkaliphilus peptidifermentans DSM 18978 TaxID=1120976 RepID=A0A1G5AMP3_9FIRM|nr:YtrH family sporulation protein [Alkaliphilus peptidifermentans]SCX79142.1 Sporulation protein YtrH [Alkaliphilus peptidifermentans DSM 18978]
MLAFYQNILYNFFISLGVMIGGCLFGGIAATFNGHPPLKTMLDLCEKIKIWAIIVALGGTFPSFKVLEIGIFNGEIRGLVKQVIYILSALLGAHIGYRLIYYLESSGPL